MSPSQEGERGLSCLGPGRGREAQGLREKRLGSHLALLLILQLCDHGQVTRPLWAPVAHLRDREQSHFCDVGL